MTGSTPHGFDDSGYVGWLLRTIKEPGARSRLRRADLPAAAYQSDPLLAQWWGPAPWLRDPLCRHAAAAARFDRVRQTSREPLGRLAWHLSAGHPAVIQKASVETRLLVVQRKPLDQSARVLGGLLAAAHNHRGFGLDWFRAWTTFRYWDAQPEDYPTRRQLLIDFYTQPTATQKTPEATA